MNYTKLARSRNFIISFFTTNSRRPTHAIMKSRLQIVKDIIDFLNHAWKWDADQKERSAFISVNPRPIKNLW